MIATPASRCPVIIPRCGPEVPSVSSAPAAVPLPGTLVLLVYAPAPSTCVLSARSLEVKPPIAVKAMPQQASFSVLRGWLLAAKPQRLLHKACRLRKRLKLEAILTEAESSTYSHAIFGAIKKLAPKSRYQRVRDEHGCLMSPTAEAAYVAAYFRGVYTQTPGRI